MSIDRPAWYRRLHAIEALNEADKRRRYGIPPAEGILFMDHDDECEECSTYRADARQNKGWLKEHASQSDRKTNLNHGSKCDSCNEGTINDMTRNDHFGTGSEEGKQ